MNSNEKCTLIIVKYQYRIQDKCHEGRRTFEKVLAFMAFFCPERHHSSRFRYTGINEHYKIFPPVWMQSYRQTWMSSPFPDEQNADA